ncbi:hypothetical protein IPC444_08905 [Pseudomonas aeruginosa]|uniref:hypothetical protein n=1 Tax=Pseudomonas aeruginosa TaxID=287 RepID=UPI000F894C92|nr:hypothetical protein [Pseudomonas aeruginosa]RUI05497.1 hypothetical protein IPC444_08905 [Pseudomonas aeruginosa]
MERFTEAIIQSVDSGIWFGALSLSLMLPDVCASLETPKAQNGERYRRWFRKWLQPRYTINIPVVGEQVFFRRKMLGSYGIAFFMLAMVRLSKPLTP